MNPYSTPTSDPAHENRTDPDFQFCGGSGEMKGYGVAGIVSIPVQWFIATSRPVHREAFLCLVLGPMAVIVLSYVIHFTVLSRRDARARREIRRHAIVRGGEALAGGSAERAGSEKESGCLFLTRTELVFIPGPGEKRAGVEQRIALGQLGLVERVRGRFLRPSRKIRLRLLSGETEEWVVSQPARWIRAIEGENSLLL